MIFTTKPLKFSHNTQNINLISFKKNISQNTKDIYFIRYVGIDGDYNRMLLSLDEDLSLTTNYFRVSSLENAVMDNELECSYMNFLNEKDKSTKEYFDCKLSYRFQDDYLEWTQKQELKNVLEVFIANKKNVTDAIIKTFVIKMLFWSRTYFDDIFRYDKPKVFVYVGKIKMQEMLFLHFINQLSCNVLYMNPYSDIIDEVSFCNNFSTIYKENCFADSSFMPIAYKKLTNTSVNQFVKKEISSDATEIHIDTPTKSPGNYGKKLSYEELALLSSSIVMINVLNDNGDVEGTGSGVIINSKGFILTNCHVISGSRNYSIVFEDNVYSEIVCELVKYNQDVDLAIIKVQTTCIPLPLRITKDIVRGEQVVAIGSPLGLLNTISDGIISAKKIQGTAMIQFTAPVSPGSSGGALIDLYGNLIGITTGGYSKGQNLNVAVDSHTIKFFANNFIERTV